MTTHENTLRELLSGASGIPSVQRWAEENVTGYLPENSGEMLESTEFIRAVGAETAKLLALQPAIVKALDKDSWPLTVVRPLAKTVLYALVLASSHTTLKVALAVLNWSGLKYLDLSAAEAMAVVQKMHEKASPAITLTFGDVAENNVGMEKIGELASEGFTLADLQLAKAAIEKKKIDGVTCTLIDLSPGLNGTSFEGEDYGAYILVVRGAIPLLAAQKKGTAKKLLAEQRKLDWDTKALMKGRVVDKKARHNLCYAEHRQEPDYENGKGRIVAYDDVPITKALREALPQYFGAKARDLMCEGNLYYDTAETGIGYHGDRERAKVIAVRLGEPMDLCYRWYLKSKWIGRQFSLTLSPGDLYAMSSKSVGRDWLVKNSPTLRHSAGCREYTSPEWRDGAPLWTSRE